MQPDTETIQKNKDDLSYFTLSNFLLSQNFIRKEAAEKTFQRSGCRRIIQT